MNIEVKSSDEFNALLNALSGEIINARVCHHIYCGLVDSIDEYQADMNHSPGFWNLSMVSIRDSRMHHLCRIYDQHFKSLNLVNLLHTIQANVYLFDTINFRERLKDNSFVESLSANPRRPDENDLKEHIAYCSCSNPLVRKLMIWRNNIIAHRGVALSLGKKEILESNPIPQNEIEALLDQALEIFNHYSYLFRASIWWPDMTGQDDYKACLKLVHMGVQKYNDNLAKERERILSIMNESAEQGVAGYPPQGVGSPER